MAAVMFAAGLAWDSVYAAMAQGSVLADPPHDQVWTAIAHESGMSYDQLQTELKTRTLPQLAEAKGVQREIPQQIAQAAHKAALEKLVERGQLSRQQAESLIQRMKTTGYPLAQRPGHGVEPGVASGGVAAAPPSQDDLTEPHEQEWNALQPPEQVMNAIGLKPGMIIGEVGAGYGRYTVHLARLSGSKLCTF